MARPLRLEHPGAIWHITSRGNERRAIVRSAADRRLFVDILGEVVPLHRWILHAWVLMTNHYHLLVETPLPSLSGGVKRLNERYAQTFNVRHRRVGHLFQGRFKGILVERESHLLELIRYVVLNPVRCGAVTYAGDYRWSSYGATAGLEAAPDWLEVGWTLDQFGRRSRGVGAARKAYRRFVADARGAEYKPWESVIGQIYLGSEQFCERMQGLVGMKKKVIEHPLAQRRFIRPTFEAVIEAVVAGFGESPLQLRERSHRRGRKALAHLAWEEGGMTLAAVGEWLGITGAAAGHLVSRSRTMETTDREYSLRLGFVRTELSPQTDSIP